MAEHTPGPWTLGKGKYRVRTEGMTMVAECYTTQNAILYPRCKEEQAANARLIVAAPDLLAACKHVIEFYCTEYGTIGAEANIPDVIAAVAKAEGEA